MSEHRVLVCGGRNYRDTRTVSRVLDKLDPKPTMIIQGGADGADACASLYASRRKIDERVFWADWKKHGRAAGPIRNQQMLDEGKPDLVVAFPGSVGTADMVRRAKAEGVRVIEVNHMGAFCSDTAPAVLALASQPNPTPGEG
jgi:UDP-N-acetylmuramoylalanine-D-glutamate ligase